jgi:hypothetical protein
MSIFDNNAPDTDSPNLIQALMTKLGIAPQQPQPQTAPVGQVQSAPLPPIAAQPAAPAPQAAPQQPQPGPVQAFFQKAAAGLGSMAHGGTLAGAASGQFDDPQSIQHRQLQQQYQALVPVLGQQGAMLAVLNPEAGKTLIASALGPHNAENLGQGYIRDPQTGKVTRAYVPEQNDNFVTVQTGEDGLGKKTFSKMNKATGEMTPIAAAPGADTGGYGDMSKTGDAYLATLPPNEAATGNTARQTIDQLTESARRESAPLYQDALNQNPVWSDRMQQFFDDPITAQGLREGVRVQRLESLATGQPFNPLDHAITGFNEAGDPIISGVPNMRTINLIKKGWDNTLEGYRDPTTGRLALDEYGRGLDNVRRSFLREVDSVNPTYGQARAAYAGPAQVRDAVGVGAQAAKSGRAADNLARFDALNPQSQQGFRAGYADTLANNIERAAPGVNKVRPLLSDKAQTELDALSLHQGPVQPGQAAPMQQRLNREQTMFETRNQALGGSRTADNLNDHEALGLNPTTVMHAASGNWTAAIGSMVHAGVRGVTGNTPAVRKAVADILLQNGATLDAPALNAMVNRTIGHIQTLQRMVRNGAGAAAVSTNSNQPKPKTPIFARTP